MQLRSTLVALLALLCAQITLKANTVYSLTFASYQNQSLNYTGNNYVSGLWTETPGGGNSSTQNIDCMVAMTNTAHTCGNPGPSSAVNIPINNAPSNYAATGTSNYFEADGDPMWAAPIYTDLDSANGDALVVGTEYTLSFWQASNEESGQPATAYNDQWQVYMISGSGAGPYICPNTVCTSGSYTNSNLVYTSPAMANPGATSTAWQLETYTFVAQSTNVILEFVTDAVVASGPEPSAGNFNPPLLDLTGVSVAQTPEPGTMTLALFGIAAVGFASWRRRRPSAANKN